MSFRVDIIPSSLMVAIQPSLVPVLMAGCCGEIQEVNNEREVEH